MRLGRWRSAVVRFEESGMSKRERERERGNVGAQLQSVGDVSYI